MHTERYDIEETIEEYRQERESLAAAVAAIPDDDRTEDNDEYVDAIQRATTLESNIGGLQYIREEYGAGVIVLSGLDSGAHARLLDQVDADRQEVNAWTPGAETSGEGLARNYWCAFGLEDAPFLDEGADLDDRLDAVAELPPQVTQWLYEEVVDLTTVGADLGNDFESLVQANDP